MPDTSHLLVEAALKTDLVDVLIGVLEKDKLDHLVDPSAAKVSLSEVTVCVLGLCAPCLCCVAVA